MSKGFGWSAVLNQAVFAMSGDGEDGTTESQRVIGLILPQRTKRAQARSGATFRATGFLAGRRFVRLHSAQTNCSRKGNQVLLDLNDLRGVGAQQFIAPFIGVHLFISLCQKRVRIHLAVGRQTYRHPDAQR